MYNFITSVRGAAASHANMPPSICLRSLAQLSRDGAAHTSIAPRSLLVAPQTSSFSTSTARFALAPAKKKGVIAAPKKGLKSLNIKRSKKAGADMGKRPAPGERKALRKRIVLSNNNALEVASLKDLDKASALSEANEGKMKGIPEDAVDVLRAVEAFKPNQGWSLFRRPAVLMRKETIQLAQLMQEAEGKKTIRRIVAGERMAGKTTMVLQGLLMAYLRGWTVINLPDGRWAHKDTLVIY
jgi:small subunit ribosomal protein S29